MKKAKSSLSIGCPRIFLAADSHLDGSPESLKNFSTLLKRARNENAVLFLLGDVFQYWYGPQHLKLAMYAKEIELLQKATQSGLEIHLIPGNRDFLLSSKFEAATGVKLHGDSLELELVLNSDSSTTQCLHLSHGDLFATQDINYQRMRRVLRSRMVSLGARLLPAFIVRAIARRVRSHSQQVVPQKVDSILQPDLSEIQKLLDSGCSHVICGHFHKWIHHELQGSETSSEETSSEPKTFIVLDCFETSGFYLKYVDGRWARAWCSSQKEECLA